MRDCFSELTIGAFMASAILFLHAEMNDRSFVDTSFAAPSSRARNFFAAFQNEWQG